MSRIAAVAAAITTFGLMGGTAGAEEPLIVASIGGLDRRVMIHDGQKYSAARLGMPLRAGQRVVTLKDSRASINFTKGCVKSLDENAVLTVSGVDLCASGMTAQGPEPMMVAQAGALGGAGVGGGVAGGGFVAGLSTTALVVGGITTAVVVGAVVNDNKNNDDPASPQ
ncbi:MAG: hypothetical protein KJZ96_13050 [Rhodocyclaceae bacterium]|nr:hypothetical protein [Rhodocyclaceae bacterium]